MGDMGLAGSMGAAGAGDAIATVLAQRRQAALDAQNQSNFQQQQAQQDALVRLKAQEQSEKIKNDLELHRQVESDRVNAAKSQATTRIDAQLREIPTDQPISQPEVASMTSGGILPSRFQPTPINEPAPPPGIAAPGAPTAPQPMPGTVANAPAPNQVSFHRIPTAQENFAEKGLEQKSGEQDWKNSIAQQLADLKSGQGPKEPPDSFQLQPEIDASGKQTGRFLGYNTKKNRWEPVQGTGPAATKAAPGAAQEAQQTKFTKDAIDSLGQTEKALDSVKDLVGPFEGRGETVEQMIGNADPKIQAFGTKLLLTKFRVDHAATGTARAGASPAIMAKWDNLLNNKVSYEGMKAALQAAREILGSDSASGAKVVRYDINGKPMQ